MIRTRTGINGVVSKWERTHGSSVYCCDANVIVTFLKRTGQIDRPNHGSRQCTGITVWTLSCTGECRKEIEFSRPISSCFSFVKYSDDEDVYDLLHFCPDSSMLQLKCPLLSLNCHKHPTIHVHIVQIFPNVIHPSF